EHRLVRMTDAGVVHHHINASEALYGGVDELLHVRRDAYIDGAEFRLMSRRAQRRRDPLAGRGLEIRDDDLRPLAGEGVADAFAETGAAAGHDGDFAMQASAHEQ